MAWIHSRLQPRRSGDGKRHLRQAALPALLLLLAVSLAGCGAGSTDPAGGVKGATEAEIARASPTEEPGGAPPRLTGDGGGGAGGVEATGVGRSSPASGDRAALAALYNATGGPNWVDNRDWLSDEPIGYWWGVRTSGGRVTELHLYGNRLSGELPPELGDLTHLERLWLWENDLEGEIPSQIGNLSELGELNIRGNRLNGEIPPEIGNLSNLEYLILNNNRLSGEIPPELGNLVNLKRLDLWDNQLSGEIPAELGNLKGLYLLSLASNQLRGQIPPELGNPENLQYLDLEDNQLRGPVPAELGRARELRLLWLSGNEINGEMPIELADRRYLDLNGSAAGCIPQGLRNVRDDRPPDEPRIVVVDRTPDTATLLVDDFDRPDSQQPFSHEWRRSDEGESGPLDLVESNVAIREYVDRGLDPDTTYYYTAKSCNRCGCSDFAFPAIGVITESDGAVNVPATPQGFAGRKVRVTGPDQAEVTWQSSPGATYYDVYQGSAGGSDWELDAAVSAPATEYRDYAPNFFSAASIPHPTGYGPATRPGARSLRTPLRFVEVNVCQRSLSAGSG
ncbi:MAG: leucine-rich repeat domain-containing protein [Chloroflexota bacterium]|nr:leucine-rich repeat domain-containing protein [Chloroflexota bacterium]